MRDGWAPYRRFDDTLHQTCVAHLLRRCQYLRDDHPDSTWAGHVAAVLQAGLALRNRRDDGKLTDHGLASVRGRLLASLGRLIDMPPSLDDAERFAAHLHTEFAAVFAFLWDPSVDATNWRAWSWGPTCAAPALLVGCHDVVRAVPDPVCRDRCHAAALVATTGRPVVTRRRPRAGPRAGATRAAGQPRLRPIEARGKLA